MKNDDSVFFFTLIDFLVMTLFFGLVLYAMAGEANAAGLKKETESERATERLTSSTGISNLTELTDRLTRLGPVNDLEQVMTHVRNTGGLNNLAKVDSLLEAAGGLDSLSVWVAKRRQQEGFGKPPCRFVVAPDGRKEPVKIASVRATDTAITIIRRSPTFDSVVTKYGIIVPPSGMFTLDEFRHQFARLPEVEPGCRYSIEFIEQTGFVYARDAAASGLRLSIVRAR